MDLFSLSSSSWFFVPQKRGRNDVEMVPGVKVMIFAGSFKLFEKKLKGVTFKNSLLLREHQIIEKCLKRARKTNTIQ